jgi:Putative Flp pilus-assembly TadE/G-like
VRSAHRCRPRGRGDEGVVTAFVVIFAVALVFVSGLVLDGGRVLASKREANNLAESAARAGAQAISDDAVRSGNAVILDGPEAESAACAFLGRAGQPCGGGTFVRTDGNEVTVTVRSSVNLLLLPVGTQTFSVDRSACVVRGITDVTSGC